jgi:3-oxoacyl-[acyl-carrier-protein] synthase-3
LAPNRNLHITGTGHATPKKVLTNEYFAGIVDTSDEWITTRTGIKTRYVGEPWEKNSDFSTAAAESALEAAGVSAEEIDYLIIGTVTGDLIFPSTACIVQERIGAHNATAWDHSAACSGFLFGLAQMSGLLRSGMGKKAIVIGCEMLSRITNYEDRSTCVLFGDGAGAVVVELKEEVPGGLLGIYTKTDGRLVHMLNAPEGGSANPPTPENIVSGQNKIHMKGNEVFKHAVRCMGDACRRVLDQAGIAPSEVDLFVPHQANLRIIEALGSRMEIDASRVFVNLQEYGNTSAASIPIALDQAVRTGRAGPGSKVLMSAFGGGLTWGAALVQL